MSPPPQVKGTEWVALHPTTRSGGQRLRSCGDIPAWPDGSLGQSPGARCKRRSQNRSSDFLSSITRARRQAEAWQVPRLGKPLPFSAAKMGGWRNASTHP